MKENKHEINGCIYVMSNEEIEERDWFTDDNNSLKRSYKLSHVQFANPKKIILTNNPNLPIQQLTEQEVEYLKSVDGFEVKKEKYSERFDNDKSPIGNPDTWGNRYVFVIPQETEQPKERIDELINKFPDGIEYYNKNALFNTLIQCIYNGMSIETALIECIKYTEKQDEQMIKIIENQPQRIIIQQT